MATKPKLLFETPFERYREVRQLASGGAGVVYVVDSEKSGQFAIKVLDPNRATSDKRRRFQNELMFCLREHDPGIIKILDHGLVDIAGVRAAFYVMPLYPSTLRNVLKQPIEPLLKLQYFFQIANALSVAHKRGVVHRDLKPENILVDPAQNKLVITDFGIARFSDEDLYTAVETRDDQRLANFLYAAPEQRERGQSIDLRTDIFSLGLMLNELFTGAVPLGTGHAAIGDKHSGLAYLDPIVERMMSYQPSRRPSSIDELLLEMNVRASKANAEQSIVALSQGALAPAKSNETDDLVLDPIRIVGHDFQHGNLMFTLSQMPNAAWTSMFATHSQSGLVGFLGENFGFAGNKASVSLQGNPSLAQQVTDQFKRFVEGTNVQYARALQAARERALQQQQQKIARQIEEEKLRASIIGSIKY